MGQARVDRPRSGDSVTFAALRIRPFRAFFIGQAISLPGTWMQTVAQGWLVIELAGSGAVLGAVVAAQYVPVLLLAPYGGVLADRFSRRRLLLGTQAAMALCAAVLGLLTLTGTVTVAAIVAVAVAFGVATAVDNPTRQSFVLEMVGPELVRNAVSLNSALLNSARAVGPAMAGIVIATAGPGWCFVVNAASFTGVVLALATMRLSRPPRGCADTSVARQLIAGFAHVAGRRELRWPCLMVFLVGCLAWEFPVTLPLLARETYSGGPEVYGWLTSSMGAGAVLGALTVARRGEVGLMPIARSAAVFGGAMLLLAVSPDARFAAAALVAVGWGGASFLSISNATIQLASDDAYRGRVMAMWSLCFIGSTPVGGPIVGAIGEFVGPRTAVMTGAIACGCASAVLALVHRRPVAPT